jgi:cytochrome-b5 reductase
MDATVAVTAVESVGPHTVAIEFESPAEFDARPGQFVKLSGTVADGALLAPGEARSDEGEEFSRFYTLSSPGVSDTFEVTVGVDPEEAGPFSERLAALAPGDELRVSGPFGNSHYEGESRVVVLAGGPGVGPAVGIGEAAVADGNDVAVVYRCDDAPAHERRLSGLRDAGATVTLLDADADLSESVAAALTGEDGEQVFVYGFADFVEAAERAIADAGGDPAAAKVENFG